MKGSDYKNNEKDLNFSEITEKLNKIGEKFENLNPMGFKFSPELIDAFVKGYEKTVNDFKTKKEVFEIQYENYIKKEGIVLPNDFSDFIFWFEELYPEQSLKDIQFSLSNPNVFKQFHEYKIRMFENSKWSILKEIEFLESQKIEAVPTPQQGIVANDFLTSTIEEYLEEFKESKVLNDENYKILVYALKYYFDNREFPILTKSIHVGRVNKKRIGWSLNLIFAAMSESINIDLLKFAKHNISIFKDVQFNENNYQKSLLYKYFTTKTP